jgi:endoglucanase
LAVRPLLVAFLLLASTMLAGCALIPRMDRHGLIALEKGRPMVGAWLGSWPTPGNPVIDKFEGETGARLDLVDVYLDWSTPVANVTYTLRNIAEHGALPVLTWEAQTITTQDILAGTRSLPLRDGRTLTIDQYVGEFATGVCRSARLSHQPVLIRMLHEMNGNWFAWGIGYEQGGHHPNSDESYKRAWVKLHDAFTSRCGNAVRFVWAVNHFSKGDGTSFLGTYPGDAYVDLVGIDGYNWGSRASWGWQDFDAIFDEGLCALQAGTTKPILIAEVGSSESGGSKSQWIHDLVTNVAARDRLRGFVWLNTAKYEVQIDGMMDWNVESSKSSLNEFATDTRSLLRDPTTMATTAQVPPCP